MSSVIINQFAGMNDCVDPMLLGSTVGRYVDNCKLDNGKIVPVRKMYNTGYTDMTQLNHYGNANRSTAKIYGRTYWSDNVNLTYGGDKENFLGVVYPEYSGSGKTVDCGVSSTGISTAKTFTGKYKYCVTYLTENKWESAPGPLTEYETDWLQPSGQYMYVSVSRPSGHTEITGFKIYRTGDNGADYYCVKEQEFGSSSSITWFDEMDDETLVLMNPLETQDNYPPPTGGKYLTEANGIFYLAVGTELYYSKVNEPHAYPPLQSVTFDNPITGIVKEFQGVLVFTANDCYRIVGAESMETITKTYIPGNHGCVTYKSLSSISNAPIWLSNDGICIWDGENVSIISLQKINTSGIGVRRGVANNGRYYLWHSKGCIVYDTRAGGVWYKYDFTCDYAWYDDVNDIMYLYANGHVYQHDAGNNLTWHYISSDIGGTELGYKIFSEVLVNCDEMCSVVVTADMGNNNYYVVERYFDAGRTRMRINATALSLKVEVKSRGQLNEIGVVYGG